MVKMAPPFPFLPAFWLTLVLAVFTSCNGFVTLQRKNHRSLSPVRSSWLSGKGADSSLLLLRSIPSQSNQPRSELHAKEDSSKSAILVSGEELEVMLTEWDTPLVIDAYATWCGPCIIMAPEFEAAAQEMKGKVRFVKLDTDKDSIMASRLNVMGLPTLLFLDKYEPKEENDENPGAQAVLKEKIEGAISKDAIVELCNYVFFDGPRPTSI